jgi:hypothetical protein
MPFGGMSDEDLLAIISFLRSPEPVRNIVPGNEWSVIGRSSRASRRPSSRGNSSTAAVLALGTVWFRTPNLTPAIDSALQRGGRHYDGSPMPWESFGRMNEEDLAALYEFLHSLAPQHGPTGDPQFKKKG